MLWSTQRRAEGAEHNSAKAAASPVTGHDGRVQAYLVAGAGSAPGASGAHRVYPTTSRKASWCLAWRLCEHSIMSEWGEVSPRASTAYPPHDPRTADRPDRGSSGGSLSGIGLQPGDQGGAGLVWYALGAVDAPQHIV